MGDLSRMGEENLKSVFGLKKDLEKLSLTLTFRTQVICSIQSNIQTNCNYCDYDFCVAKFRGHGRMANLLVKEYN